MQARVVTLSNSFQQSNLQTLTSLSKLQALTFTMSGAYRDYPSYSGVDNAALQLAVQQFPGRLPSLTKLELPLGVLQDISSVSQCTRLRDLQLQHTRAHDGWRCLCAAEAHLTCLTCLHVGLDIDCDDDAAASYSVLGKLKKLQVVGAYMWGPSSLPALQSLTRVTNIVGGWNVNGSHNFSGLACSHVKELKVDWCDEDLPYGAFPNASYVTLQTIEDGAGKFQALCQCCTALQTLQMASVDFEDVHSRTSAFDALARLPHLTHLAFSPSGVQLSAFISAYIKGGSLQLRRLQVSGDWWSFEGLTLFDLWSLQLLGLRGLQELDVCFMGNDVTDTFTVQGVGAS